jgi:hypothetical protein
VASLEQAERPGIVQVAYREPDDGLQGRYVLYLQVERLP